MCVCLLIKTLQLLYVLLSSVTLGDWLLFGAEIAVAAVIYAELEHSRQIAFLEKATAHTSDQERRDIYGAFLALSGNYECLGDRAKAFKTTMFNDQSLKTKCDNEIALFNAIGFMISPRIAQRKVLVETFPQASVYIWIILKPYVLQRRSDTGPYFARHFFDFTERCLRFLIKQDKDLHLRRPDGTDGFRITLAELREMYHEIRNLN